MELSKLSNKEFQIMIINMLTELGRRINEHSEYLNVRIENIRKYQTEVMTVLENTLKGFNSR